VFFKNFAGLPATMVFGATSFVTTEPAPMMAFSPIVIPHKIVGPFLNECFYDLPISFGLRRAIGIGSAGYQVICKHHSVADKAIIRDMNTFTNKRVTGNFAVLTDGSTFLYFNKSAHLRAIVYTAAVGIHEVENAHVFAHFHIIQ